MMISLEIIGTLFALFGVWLTARQYSICWPVAMVAVVIYIYLYFQNQLYGDSALQAIYLILSLYGWYQWVFGGKDQASLKPSYLSRRTFSATSALGVAGTFLIAYILQMTDSDVVWFDAVTTSFSLVTTWMMARKIIESWLYWIVIDALYVGILIYKEMYVTSFQYFVFTMLAIYGLLTWRKLLRQSFALVK